MSMPIAAVGKAINLTATTASVTAGPCQLLGFYVNSTTSGTLILDDGGTALDGTITPAIGFHEFCADIGNKLGVTVGNTINVTFFVAAGN